MVLAGPSSTGPCRHMSHKRPVAAFVLLTCSSSFLDPVFHSSVFSVSCIVDFAVSEISSVDRLFCVLKQFVSPVSFSITTISSKVP